MIAPPQGRNFISLKKVWPRLEQDEIVVETRVLAGTTLYRINAVNPIVQKIIELNNFLCWQQAEKGEEIMAQ